MNPNIIKEIEIKRKKFLKHIFYFFVVLFVIFLLLIIFLPYNKFEISLYTLILAMFVSAIYSNSVKKDISMKSIYNVAEQITGFKPIPLCNEEHREYDSYLPSEIDWSKLPIPPEKVLFSTILPRFDIYNIKIKTMFTGVNNLQQEINLCDLTVFKDFHSGNPEKEFSALILTIKTDKNLNSITYFQTHLAFKEEFDIKLPKMNFGGNIDIYSNNADISKQLLTSELKEKLNELKKQFKVEYVKAVFYNEYIVFVLNSFDEEDHNYFPINISLLKNFNMDEAIKAVKNFKTLYDLANQAPEFTKNI